MLRLESEWNVSNYTTFSIVLSIYYIVQYCTAQQCIGYKPIVGITLMHEHNINSVPSKDCTT